MRRERGAREELLARLPYLLHERLEEVERAQELLHDAARDMVLGGYSWADVGRLLGVSRQAARQRFGAGVAEWREHSPNVMPWEVEVDFFEDPEATMAEFADLERLRQGGPVEDRR